MNDGRQPPKPSLRPRRRSARRDANEPTSLNVGVPGITPPPADEQSKTEAELQEQERQKRP